MMSEPTENRKSLKGKRKKQLPENANPLFTQWLMEWKNEAAEKGWKSAHTYGKALKTLKLFPLPLETGKDCRLLQNFGEKICKMLDEKLEQYKKDHGGQQITTSSGHTVPAVSSPLMTLTGTSKASTSSCHTLSDSDSESGAPKQPPKKKRQPSSARQPSSTRTKEYVPTYRSGPYALLLTLHKCMQDPEFKGFMTKSELSHAAQPLCEKSFIIPDPGSRYTAWSSMGSLIKKGLIAKGSNPAKFSLTDEGFALADRLAIADVCNMSLQSDNLTSPTSSGSEMPSSRTQASSLSPLGTYSPLPSSREESSPVKATFSQSNGTSVKRECQSNFSAPEQMGLPSFANRSLNSEILVLSDDEEATNCTADPDIPVHKVNDSDLEGFSPQKMMRLHSLSPSPPPSPSSDLGNDVSSHNEMCPIDINNPGSIAPQTYLPHSSSGGSHLNDSVLEISDDEKEDDRSVKNTQHSSLKYQGLNDDDDELPDFDVPLSKRLLMKGNLNSQLLGTVCSTKPLVTSKIHASERLPKIHYDDNKKDPDRAKTDISQKHERGISQNEKTTLLNKQNTKDFSAVPDCSSIETNLSSQSSSASMSSYAPVCPSFTLLPGSFDVVLCLDNREFYGKKSSSKTLLPDLMKAGVQCDLRLLHVGDLLWIAKEKIPLDCDSSERPKGREIVLDYIVERKRMDDLVSSMTDGRMKEQKFRLKHCGVKELIILIEEYGSIQNFSMSEDRILQSIVNSQMIDGFKVKRCGGTKDAVVYLANMTRFLQRHYGSKTLHAVSLDQCKQGKEQRTLHQADQYLMPFSVFNEASIKQKDLSVRELFAKQLIQIPGVSADRARAITNVYPSLVSLLNAYKTCESTKEKDGLLANIKCGKKERNLGMVLSRVLSMLYTETGSLC